MSDRGGGTGKTIAILAVTGVVIYFAYELVLKPLGALEGFIGNVVNAVTGTATGLITSVGPGCSFTPRPPTYQTIQTIANATSEFHGSGLDMLQTGNVRVSGFAASAVAGWTLLAAKAGMTPSQYIRANGLQPAKPGWKLLTGTQTPAMIAVAAAHYMCRPGDSTIIAQATAMAQAMIST